MVPAFRVPVTMGGFALKALVPVEGHAMDMARVGTLLFASAGVVAASIVTGPTRDSGVLLKSVSGL